MTDASRMLHGEAVYAVGANHATHMYGPLVTVLLAEVFRFTGPVLYVGRLASLLSAIAVLSMLAMIFGRGNRWEYVVTVALLLAANTRTSNYFVETRPDLDSLLFAACALIVLYKGLETAKAGPRPALILAGSVLLPIAVLFKQTAAVFMFVPVLSLVAQWGAPSFRKRAFAAVIPIVTVLGTLGVIRLFAPGLWHFMVEVPAQYRVPPFRATRMLVEFLVSLPLFLLALIHWLFTDAQDTWRVARVRWLLAVLICTIPTSIVAFAKEGGAPNSLIPALLGVGAFCAWRAPVAFAALQEAIRPLPLRVVAGVLLGAMLFMQVYPSPGVLTSETLKGGHGVRERAQVIAEARMLPGKVVSPDDPTIALMAKGYAGRTAVFEADAVEWSPNRLQALVKELRSADYVIAMQPGSPNEKALVTTPLRWDEERLLETSGFTRSTFRTVSTPVYELWRHAPLAGPPYPLAR